MTYPAVVNFENKTGAVELREFSRPSISEEDVLLQVEAVSICGSDLHQWQALHSWPVNYPVVLGHGMGDSCFNPGFKSVTRAVGDKLSTYATCIPTGDNVIADTLSSFLMTMDRNVDEFAMR